MHGTLLVKAEIGRPKEKGRRAPPIEQLRVIVLDSSPTSRKVLEVILRRAGHQVASFNEPLEALRFLARQGSADLLFLGLDLPRMDGFAVLKYLRGETRFRTMATIALLDARDGILTQAKARLAGARQVDEAAGTAAHRRPAGRICVLEHCRSGSEPANRTPRARLR